MGAAAHGLPIFQTPRHSGYIVVTWRKFIDRLSPNVRQLAAAAALLTATMLLNLLAEASAKLYPEFDFGQGTIALLLWLATTLFVVVRAIVRLCQLRLTDGIILLLLCAMLFPIRVGLSIDAPAFKFWLNRGTYEAIIQSDPSPAPKYRFFDWGSRNQGLILAGVFMEAVIYDESDEIALSPELRSDAWRQRRANSPREQFWVTNPGYPCRRTTRRLAEHFYYIADDC